MAISRERKESSVAQFKEKFDSGKIVVFVNFQGMSVSDVTKLRRVISAKGGAMQVLKKTLMDRALLQLDYKVDIRSLQGEIAAIFGFEEELSVVKAIDEFAKEKGLPAFRIGLMGSTVLDEGALKVLAKIPSREILLGSLVGSIAAPMSGILNVFIGNARNLVYALNAIGKSKA